MGRYIPARRGSRPIQAPKKEKLSDAERKAALLEKWEKAARAEAMQLPIGERSATELEKLCVENSLINAMNTVIRSYWLADKLQIDGLNDVRDYLWRIYSKSDFGFPGLTSGESAEIIERIVQSSINSGYPENKIPRRETRITFPFLMEHLKMDREEIKRMEHTLSRIGDFLEINGDKRGETLIEALFVINEIVLI